MPHRYETFGLATINTPLAIGATIYYIVHHIIVPDDAVPVLAVGLIERKAGSTSILKVKGLMRGAPLLAVLYFIPAINLGGPPAVLGFIGKYASRRGRPGGTPVMMVLIVGGIVTSVLTPLTP